MFHPVLHGCIRLLAYALATVVFPAAQALVYPDITATPIIRSAVTGKVDFVLVEKSARTLYLMRNGQVMRSYPIVLGKNPIGHKQEAGDGRTPEGRYLLDWRNPDSLFYRSIHISYPNEEDLAWAEANNRDPGNLIMIHGSPAWVPSVEWAKQWLHQEDWTEGCIAVTNDVMDEIWNLVKDGTPIEIRP